MEMGISLICEKTIILFTKPSALAQLRVILSFPLPSNDIFPKFIKGEKKNPNIHKKLSKTPLHKCKSLSGIF